MSDFYLSDMIVASIPFNGSADLDDTSETNFFPSYRYAEPNMLFDVAEQYMLLPLLEDPIRSSNASDEKLSEEAMLNSSETGMYFAIDQMRPCNEELVVSNSDSVQTDFFDPQLFIKNVPELSDAVTNFQPSPLPKEASKGKSITLVLDLDGK